MKQVKSISEETDIIPHLLAESVVFDYHSITDKQVIANLAGRAETLFKSNPQFRTGVKQKGNKGRNYLEAFMRHWLAGLLFPSAPKGESPYDISSNSK